MEGHLGADYGEHSPTTKRAELKETKATDYYVSVPKGLVGNKVTAHVKMAGHPTPCLLDSGSQVTTIPLSFHAQFLTDHPIKPLTLLEIEGANGQKVPYLGYVEVCVTFPPDFVGKDVDVSTLALVVPNHGGHTDQVLIGTNTLDILYCDYCQHNPSFVPVQPGYRAVLKIMELRHTHSQNGQLGLVKHQGQTPEVIPAYSTVVLQGIVITRGIHSEKWALQEPPLASSLPCGVLVPSCLITLPSKPFSRLPVLLRNETGHDVILPPKTVLAELSAVQTIIKQQSVVPATYPQPDSPQPPEPHKPSLDLSFEFGNSPLSPEWKERITNKLKSLPEVFAHHDLDFGHTDKVKHQIKLSDETPFKQRARPIQPQDVDAVRKHLQELLEAGVIRESESPFSSPIVVIRKKNGSVRLCIDYRKLNMQTIKDAYALPNVEESFRALTGSKWFSVLDLKSGYYQIEMNDADKAKTAFVCPLGFWEWNRMPQGITNAPSTFQRLMERCMGDLNLKEVLVFIDDLIIFSDTLEEHEKRLFKVLQRLKEYGLKLSPEKCKFFQSSVRYLGHIVSANGVETDPEKIEALKTWPQPKTLKELRSFLGFSGYYRRFINDYSKMVKPLNDLTAGYPPLHDLGNKSPSSQYHNVKEPFGSRWTPTCQEAFETLIEHLCTAPVLGFADPKLPYILHTDASTTGVGAALYQEQEGKLRPLAFASRGLSRSESKYPAHKLEFLALKWSITEKFGDYLYGNYFTVVTDSNPLTYLLTTAKLDATSYRWLSDLSTFTFRLQYRAGKQNLDADALSRRPHGDLLNDQSSQKEIERIRQFALQHLSEAEVQAICDKHIVCNSMGVADVLDGYNPVPFIESLALHPDVVPTALLDGKESGLPVIFHLTEEDLREKQRTDPCIREVIYQMESGVTPSPTLRANLPDLSLLLREWNRLVLKDGILFRKRQEGASTTLQLVLPTELRESALQSLHDDMGHLGVDRVLDLVRARFFWPRMATSVERKIQTCERCVRRKTLPEKAAPLVNILTSRPLELLCMDYLSVEPDRSNTKDILVITDHFTKYAIAIPTPNQKAHTVAKALWDHFIVHYGFPERLHSDQGPDFESKTIKELCDIAQIKKVRTTPYHPRGNPVERFNRTLLQMLGTLSHKDKTRWKDFVKPLVHAYNCTKNDTTGFSPYELMFGRQPRLPIDLAFGLPPDSSRPSHSQYVQKLKSNLEESYRIATSNAAKNAERNKVRFDKRVTESTLNVGDRVLVRSVRLRGKQKLADKWEMDIYVVVKRAGELPVYTVKPEGKDSPLRTLHRDLLLPCGFLPVSEPVDPVTPSPPRRLPTRENPCPNSDSIHEDDDLDSDSDCDGPLQGNLHLHPSKVTRVYRRNQLREPVCKGLRSPRTTSSPVRSPVEPFSGREGSASAPVDEMMEDNLDRPGTELEERVSDPVDVADLDNSVEPAQESHDMSPPNVELDSPGGNHSHDLENRGNLEEPESGGNSSQHDEGILSEMSNNQNPLVGEAVLPAASGEVVEQNEAVDQDVAQDNDTHADEASRYPQRQRKKPDFFHYPELGNPLISVIQSLFQGLSTAVTSSLAYPSPIAPSLPPRLDAPVTIQPFKRCSGTCIESGREDVTLVK